MTPAEKAARFQRLRHLMAGRTISEIALASGLARQAVHAVVTGKFHVSRATATKLAPVLGCQPDEITTVTEKDQLFALNKAAIQSGLGFYQQRERLASAIAAQELTRIAARSRRR